MHEPLTLPVAHAVAQVPITLIGGSQANPSLMIHGPFSLLISCHHGTAHLCQARSVLFPFPCHSLATPPHLGPAPLRASPGIVEAWGQVACPLGSDCTRRPSASTWATHQGGARMHKMPSGGGQLAGAAPLAPWHAPTGICQALAATCHALAGAARGCAGVHSMVHMVLGMHH